MGFEDQIPPVPNRRQEQNYIRKVEASFADQPFYKLYMNEALRTKKMEYVQRLNQYRLEWWYNFSLGGIIFGTLFVVPCSYMYRNAGNTPYIYAPKSRQWRQSYLQNRNIKQIRALVALTVGAAAWFAYSYADISLYDDEYYTNTAAIVETFDE